MARTELTTEFYNEYIEAKEREEKAKAYSRSVRESRIQKAKAKFVAKLIGEASFLFVILSILAKELLILQNLL